MIITLNIIVNTKYCEGFPYSSVSKESACKFCQETQVQLLGQEDPLEEGMAIHYIVLAWRIPWTEEPGRLQHIGSHRVGHE